MGILNHLHHPFSGLSLLFLILPTTSLPPPYNNGTGYSGNPAPPPQLQIGTMINQFKPGIAAIVAILTILFSIIFLLLLYVKHCKSTAAASAAASSRGHPISGPTGRVSGVERKVIESLPLFRFASLRGQKDGLECSVCLSRFEPEEVLRLLPKCKHAFHIECIDTWLDAHSTCPLCRYRVEPEDLLLLEGRAMGTPRGSDHGNKEINRRVSGRHSSSAGEGVSSPSLEIIVENNPSGPDIHGRRASVDSWSSRRRARRDPRSKSLDCQRQAAAACRKDGELPVRGEAHRVEHRIVISGEEGERRWSDAQAAEVLYLRTEMILENESGKGVINGRSMSETTGVSRYRCTSNNDDHNNKNGSSKSNNKGAVQRWLDWIAESKNHHRDNTPTPAVNSATFPSSASPSAPL